MAIDVLSRVQNLIAMSDSPFSEEARTAAFQAVTLIKKYNLLKTSGPRIEETPPPPRPSPPKAHKTPKHTAPPPSEPPKAAPPPPMSRNRIRDAAMAKADRFREFLVKKAKLHKEFPIYSVRKLTEQSVRQHIINPVDQAVFHYFLGIELANLRRKGILESLPARGFRLKVQEKIKKPKTNINDKRRSA